MNKKDDADQNFQEATEQPKIGKEQPATPPSIPAHPLSLLPRIRSNLQGGNAIWIVSASAMAFAAFIPLGGRLADVLSPPFGEFETGF
ncbi:hypothetical protein QFC24_000033 [Naganishia onofrii]|uniref:Uncharacterized protein n=1 Tax=Naganishia onofrii TaxID=1851511 RepID=A0ACC2XUN4_9TREE|nr:hypothetical protein QFC24_000033 [Naganishia onofrii]